MKKLKEMFISILEAIQEARAYKAKKYNNLL